jgi:RNA polymerase sigma factor (sigma-70 family)
LTATPAHLAIAAIWRRESARVVAMLVRLVRDVGRAEELAQDALVAALEQWPREGIPQRPGAWLTTVARRRALNSISRASMIDRKHDEIANEGEAEPDAIEAAVDEVVGDDVLRLVFIACHPALSQPARVALTLRLLGGLATDEIARAFLVPEPTIAQRIVRAKKTLAEQRVPFELPPASELGERLASVLEVVYLVFNEGHAATAGDDLMRPALCAEALRLGRLLAELAPHEPEVHALVALMELTASRSAARIDDDGEPVLLLAQDRGRWDRDAIDRGLAALARAGDSHGPYALQAAIAACHARARTADETDWSYIAALYGELSTTTRSPVVELNRAMAVAMAEGPAAGLAILDRLAHEPSLRAYHLLPGARAHLLLELGRRVEARAELERAASLTKNARTRARLLARAAECSD